MNDYYDVSLKEYRLNEIEKLNSSKSLNSWVFIIVGKKEDIKVIGTRHGEKMYETLLTKEEAARLLIWVTSMLCLRITVT